MRKKVTKGFMNRALALVSSVALLAGVSNTVLFADARQSLNPDPSSPQYYQKYSTIEEARKAGNEINERIAEEGIALFKNAEVNGKAALPVAKGSKITLFGSCSTNLRQSGGGSGSGQSNAGEYRTTMEVFTSAGFKVNKTVYDMYEALNTRSEVAVSNYTNAITNSYEEYNDAAIIFVSRAAGGENYDAYLGNGTTNHSQQMDNNEIALFEHVKAAKDSSGNPVFNKIIVCINTADPFEVARYQDDARVHGVIWMGLLGSTGLNALPKIINGEVNPSAHTVDIWPADLRKDPAWFNFADNNQVGGSIDITGTTPAGDDLIGDAIADDGQVGRPIFKATTYKEGIYMGYRWYETAATIDGYFNEEAGYADPLHADDAYYNRFNGVLYPFGYGLSYTSFEWTAGRPSLEAGEITADDAGTEVTIPVTVKNTGSTAGKDVVQLYAREPYGETSNIEKSDVTFINSAKTDLLQPGEEQTVEITFNIRDLASFDWNDINKNGFRGYELEAGEYDLLLRTDSHNDKNGVEKIAYVVGKTIRYNSEDKNSPLNYNQGYGENAKAVLSQADEYNCSGVGAISADGAHATYEDMDYVTRADWKLPEPSTAEQLHWTNEALYILFNQTYTSSAGTNGDKETDPWYKTSEDIPGYGKSRSELAEGDWKQASDEEVEARENGKTEIQLKDMIGIPFDDVRWVSFMNQMSFDEMVTITQNGWYKSPGLASIGKPETEEKDGPGQLNAQAGRGTFWCCETTLSATYNPGLAYEMGYQTGQECLVLNISGWYAPGANTHRLAFNGRNFEYYSSDGRQGGYMCAAEIRGVVDNGIHVYAKHYVCNDMETCRNYGGGVSIFLTEQALREIYLKPFEIATKLGNMNGIMTCHGKVGLIRAESNYMLTKYFLYDECGYDGSSITDADAGDYTNVIGGSAQQVTGDRLERCFVVPLAWNTAKASSESALNGRRVEGRYDAQNNKIMVPAITVDQSSWHYVAEKWDTYEEFTGYEANVAHSDAWDKESPTQWYAVRTTAQYLLYQVANSAQMGTGMGDQVGATVTVHCGRDAETEEIKCKLGELIAEPQAPSVGIDERFAGWYTDENYTQPANFPMSVVKPVQLYALIVPMTSCIQSFDLNYSGAQVPAQYYEEGSVVNLPAFDPVRTGYIFDGWYLEATCVNKVNPNDNSALTINTDRTFYAKWIAVARLTVSYNLNYENGPSAKTVTVNSGDKVFPPEFMPVREGYVFKGWYEDESCEYEADFSQAINYDTVFYAGWEKAEAPAAKSNTSGLVGAYAGAGVVAAAGIAVLAVGLVFWKKSKS